jgi:hypothetical protein
LSSIKSYLIVVHKDWSRAEKAIGNSDEPTIIPINYVETKADTYADRGREHAKGYASLTNPGSIVVLYLKGALQKEFPRLWVP